MPVAGGGAVVAVGACAGRGGVGAGVCAGRGALGARAGVDGAGGLTAWGASGQGRRTGSGCGGRAPPPDGSTTATPGRLPTLPTSAPEPPRSPSARFQP